MKLTSKITGTVFDGFQYESIDKHLEFMGILKESFPAYTLKFKEDTGHIEVWTKSTVPYQVYRITDWVVRNLDNVFVARCLTNEDVMSTFDKEDS